MIGSKWFCEPDDERESWCFLTLESVDSGGAIEEWSIGYGNPEKMVRTESCKKPDERELLQELLKELYYCRKNEVKLITFEPVLPKIRTRVFTLGLQNAGLKAVTGICIRRVLKKYFSGFDGEINLRDVYRMNGLSGKNFRPDDLKNPEILREILLAVGPIIPKKCFRGGMDP